MPTKTKKRKKHKQQALHSSYHIIPKPNAMPEVDVYHFTIMLLHSFVIFFILLAAFDFLALSTGIKLNPAFSNPVGYFIKLVTAISETNIKNYNYSNLPIQNISQDNTSQFSLNSPAQVTLYSPGEFLHLYPILPYIIALCLLVVFIVLLIIKLVHIKNRYVSSFETTNAKTKNKIKVNNKKNDRRISNVVRALKQRKQKMSKKESLLDVVYDVLSKYKQITMQQLADGLSIDKNKAEELAKTLADLGLASMHYGFRSIAITFRS